MAFLSQGTVLLATMGCFSDVVTGKEVTPLLYYTLYYTDGQGAPVLLACGCSRRGKAASCRQSTTGWPTCARAIR